MYYKFVPFMSKSYLDETGACGDGQMVFERVFGPGPVEVSVENLEKWVAAGNNPWMLVYWGLDMTNIFNNRLLAGRKITNYLHEENNQIFNNNLTAIEALGKIISGETRVPRNEEEQIGWLLEGEVLCRRCIQYEDCIGRDLKALRLRHLLGHKQHCHRCRELLMEGETPDYFPKKGVRKWSWMLRPLRKLRTIPQTLLRGS